MMNTRLYEKLMGKPSVFFVLLIFFSTISLTGWGISFTTAWADAVSTGAVASGPDDLGDGAVSDKDVSEEDVVVDEDGTVYINGIAVEDGTVLDDGTVVSIKDVPGNDDETDTGVSDEPFSLNIQFVDRQTTVTFLPTEEGVEIQKEVLNQNSETRGEVRNLLPDGRVELTVHIAPGKKAQSELHLKFALELRKGMYADLLVWDSGIQQFSDVLSVDDVGPDVEKSVALTLLLPPELVERLRGSIGTSKTFKIVSWIDGSADVSEISDLMIVELPDRFTDERNKTSRSKRDDWTELLNFEISEDFLKKLRVLELPAELLKEFENRKNQVIKGYQELSDIIKAVTDEGQYSKYLSTILECAKEFVLSKIGLDWSKGFEKNFGNRNFGARIEGNANAKLTREGASAQVDGLAELTILDNNFEFLAAEGSASAASPDAENPSQAELEIRFLGSTIWSYDGDSSRSKRFSKVLLKGDKKTFTKEVGASTTIVIVIIPVTFEAGGRGELGIQWADIVVSADWGGSLGADGGLSVHAGGNFSAKIGALVDAGAYGSAKVDLVIASAGVKGTLSLIKDEFWGEATCSMELRNNACGLWGNLNFMAYNDLYGPNGKFGPFLTWQSLGICHKEICFWKCIRIPYPCFEKQEKWWVLVDWQSYHRRDTLINLNKSVTIELRDCQPPDSPVLFVSPAYRTVSKTGGKVTFNVTNSGIGAMNWTAEINDAPWLRIDSGSSGSNNGAITVSYDANSGEARTATITVKTPDADNSPQTVEVRQSDKLIGDFNEDGTVDGNDLELLKAHWLCKEGDICWDPKYNLNATTDIFSGKQIVDYKDLAEFADCMSP